MFTAFQWGLSTCSNSRFYVHLPKDRSQAVNECIRLIATVENYSRFTVIRKLPEIAPGQTGFAFLIP